MSEKIQSSSDEYISIGSLNNVWGVAIGRNTSVTITPTNNAPPQTLGDRITRAFSKAELARLCASLNIIYEDIERTTKTGTAHELVDYHVRRNDLETLLAALEAERPNVAFDWRNSFSNQ